MIPNQDKTVPRTFMTPAYVREIEPDLFEMYRDVEIEVDGKREKFGKSIGPVMVLRPARKGEKVDFITTKGQDVIELHRIDAPKPELDIDNIENYLKGMK